MELETSYPVVVTDKLIEVPRLLHPLVRIPGRLRGDVVRLSDLLGGGPTRIAFMTPGHPSRPPGPEAFDNEGILLNLQVPDAASEFERVRTSGLVVDHPLRDEPWGQRRFGLKDPACVWVDVVEQIDPEPGYWDPYT